MKPTPDTGASTTTEEGKHAMPRLPVIDPATTEGRVKEIFEGPLKGKELNIFKGMANSPAVLDTYLGMAGALAKTGLTAQEREAIQLAIGEGNGCGYCVAAHSAIAKGLGMSDEDRLAARRGSMPNNAKVDAVIRFALVLHKKQGRASEQDIADFCAAGFAPQHVGEVVATYALALFTNYFNLVNDTDIDFPAVPAI
jgi:AhpD family alkylhydroperoxidase